MRRPSALRYRQLGAVLLDPEKLQAVKGLLAEGLSKAEIARQLTIALSTVYGAITLLSMATSTPTGSTASTWTRTFTEPH